MLLKKATEPNMQLRREAQHKFTTAFREWYKNVQDLLDWTLSRKRYFQYFTFVVGKIRVIYEMQAYSKVMATQESISGRPVIKMPDIKPIVVDMLKEVDQAHQYFQSVGHIENQVVTLVAKYELHHFIGDTQEADTALTAAENLVETYELTDKKRKLIHLKKEGTTHEIFKKWVDDIFEEAEKANKEMMAMFEEMLQADANEKELTVKEDKYTIQLFPIGFFHFPTSAKEKVYQILKIDNPQVMVQFDSLFDHVIPIANIFHEEITQEGPRNGKLADRGVEAWRNVYRVRMAFHENKFYRTELKVG